MNALEILSHFEQVRRVGDEWSARCPAHEDRKPSLSIREEGGKILLHCHAGCSVESVLEAAALRMVDLFDDSLEAHIAATYAYCDEGGTLLFEVVRYEPKGFKQRRPDGNGGWNWNLNGVRRVPYRLPEVLKAKSVLVVEGEKDCETAHRVGIVATCNAGGAGKWRAEYSECLRGKRVAIISDADEPGRKHAQEVAASLFGKVESLKVLELPGVKDLSEWIEGGGTRGVLVEFIREAPQWTTQSSATAEATARIIRTWDEIPDATMMAATKIEWVVEGIIPRASVTLIAGEPGSYKSWLALSLLGSIVCGKKYLERECAALPVLYLDRENPLPVVHERLAILGIESLCDSRIWGGWLPDNPPAIGDERLVQIARERCPLLIFDSLIRFHTADENSATEMAQVMQNLRMLANVGATVVALHHRPKSETSRYRGSSDIAGGVDTAFSVSRDRQTGIVELGCFKSRFIEEFSITLRPDLTGAGEFAVTEAPETATARNEAEQLVQAIRTNPGWTQSQLLGASGIPTGRARAMLARFDGELWRSQRGPHNAKLFFPLEVPATVEIEV